MYCKKCGNPVDKDLNYCPNCGSKLKEDILNDNSNTKKIPWFYILLTLLLLLLSKILWSKFSFLCLIFAIILNIFGLFKYKRNGILIFLIFLLAHIFTYTIIFVSIYNDFMDCTESGVKEVENMADVISSCD